MSDYGTKVKKMGIGFPFMVTGINIKMSRESNPSSMNIQVRQTYLSTI